MALSLPGSCLIPIYCCRDMNNGDNGEQAERQAIQQDSPLSLGELVAIILSGHLGVRRREKRVSDFRRANGVQVLLAAVMYFASVVTLLILLVRYIAG